MTASRIPSRVFTSMMHAGTHLSASKIETSRSFFIAARSKVTLRLLRFGALQPGNGMPVSRSSMNLLLHERKIPWSGSMQVLNPLLLSRTEKRLRIPSFSAPTRKRLRRHRGNFQKRRVELLNGRNPERLSHASMNGSPIGATILLTRPPSRMLVF
jgi:hypothetical protein